MSRRTQLLNMIDRYITSLSYLPMELEQQLAKAKHLLEQMSDEQFDKMSDNVFSSPAHEHKLDENNPNFILQSLYSEMERTARKEQNDELQSVIKEMQNYYGITDKDGYFP